MCKRTPRGGLGLVLTLVLFLTAAVGNHAAFDEHTDTHSIALRRFDSEYATAVVYAGSPPRAVHFALVFGGGRHIARDANGTVTNVDMPGQKPGVVVDWRDPLARGLHVPSLAAASTVDLPGVRLLTRGRTIWVTANVSTDIARMRGASGSPRARGLIDCTGGSTIFSRWRYAEVSASSVTFNAVPPASDHPGAIHVQCSYFDARGRCVLADERVEMVRTPHISGIVRRTPIVVDIVLDFTHPQSELPPAQYAPLRLAQYRGERGHAVPYGSVEKLEWRSHALASVADVGDGTSAGLGESARTPPFVPGRTTGERPRIVLGTHMLRRMFSVVGFDSGSASFTLVFTVDLPAAVRATLAITLLFQTVMLVQYMVSPLNLGLGRILRGGIDVAEVNRPMRTLAELGGIVVAALQIVLGMVYTGAGVGADYYVGVAMWRLGILAGIVAGVQLVIWAAITVEQMGQREHETGTTSPDHALTRLTTAMLAQGGSATIVGIGMIMSLAPAAGVHMTGLLFLTIVATIFVLPNMAYMTAAALVIGIASRSRHPMMRRAVCVAAVNVAAFFVLCYAVHAHVVRAMLVAWNVYYAPVTLEITSLLVVSGTIIAVMALIFAELRVILHVVFGPTPGNGQVNAE